MIGYLRRKGVEEEDARAVVRELEERGLIDSARYAAAIARSQIARGKGPMAVLAKLRRRGLSGDLGQARRLYEHEAGGPEAEAEAVRKVLASRYPDLDREDPKQMNRAYAALLRRGFSPSVIRNVLRLE
jgi:SOS response regulatory protein OraA/RecX